MTKPQETVQQILDNFRQDGLSYTDYLQSKPSASDEAVVRLKIVEPLLRALGYDLQRDLDPEHREGDSAIDILAEVDGVPVMLWELKRTQEVDLKRHEEQLTRYVLAKGVTHAMLCNGRQVRVYQRVGDVLRFSYAFPLMVFASGMLIPPTQDNLRALDAFFDAFHKRSFQQIKQQKQDIIATTTRPLVLDPHQPQNETLLIKDLKREIRRLQRFVLLRFRSQRRRYEEFQTEEQRLMSRAQEEREKLQQRLEDFASQARLSFDWAIVDAYLDDFSERWTEIEVDAFTAGALERTGIERHLNGTWRSNIERRLQEFYSAFTGYARWQAQQRVQLRTIRALMENFDHWREEIGVMAEEPEAEFCLQTVYIFVTRLLLIRICEDKDLITQKISDGGYKGYLDFSEHFFSNIADAHATLLDLAYKDTSYIYGHFFSQDVFDWYTWEEETIVRLFWTLNRFDFENVSADLIGHIYEEYVDDLERKRKGQFYTPPQVINYILDQVGYEGPEIIGRRLLDPACGSGRFLVEAARRLVGELRRRIGSEEPKALVNERLRDSLFGMDVNRFACFLAEVNLLVQVLDLLKGSPKFTIERFHIYPTNTLLPRKQAPVALIGPGNGITYEREVAELIKTRGHNPALGLDFRRGFDYVVGNPPYVRADNPGVSALRARIEASGRYSTLYKKWDLYIPFIEFAVGLLVEGGKHGFIVSDAYQTEEYGKHSRAFLLKETTIENLTFAPDVRFFEEAQVHNLIYTVRRGGPSKGHKVKRYKAVDAALGPSDVKTLPALSQTRWGEQIFRVAFEGDAGLDFSGCIELGEICYISKGMVLHSKPEFDRVVGGKRQKLFIKDDLLSERRDEIHSKRYVEGSGLSRYVIEDSFWLEWETERVPHKVSRPCFPELFSNKKVMVARITNDEITAFYDREGVGTNHTIIHCVPYHHLLDVMDTVARLLVRHLSDEDFEYYSRGTERTKTEIAERVVDARARISAKYDLCFVTALLNTRWLSRYIVKTKRRGRLDFYPNDLRRYPIATADTETQSQIARLVDEIMQARADVQTWRDRGHQIDESGVLLNPRPYLDDWGINHGDLIDASGFLNFEIGGHITTLERDGQRVIFRKVPLSYVESPHDEVLDYVALYLETNQGALDALPASQMARAIRIPRSPIEVRRFLDRLEEERERVMLCWMVAAQRENLIDEWAFDLYEVEDDQREELGGTLYTLDNVPGNCIYVSILDNAGDSPLRRVAFQKDGAWCYRTEASLPGAVLIWMHDGERAEARHAVVGGNGSIVVA